jgi:hypothetical protein
VVELDEQLGQVLVQEQQLLVLVLVLVRQRELVQLLEQQWRHHNQQQL